MRSDSSVIRECLAFRISTAMEISSPLMTHLCAAQRVIGWISDDSFSRKYCDRRKFNAFMVAGSLRRELSSLQSVDLVSIDDKVRVMEMEWWSESIIGSMVAVTRDSRSDWVKKK